MWVREFVNFKHKHTQHTLPHTERHTKVSRASAFVRYACMRACKCKNVTAECSKWKQSTIAHTPIYLATDTHTSIYLHIYRHILQHINALWQPNNAIDALQRFNLAAMFALLIRPGSPSTRLCVYHIWYMLVCVPKAHNINADITSV